MLIRLPRQLPIDYTQPQFTLLVVWLLSMISLPIVKFFYGETGVQWGVIYTTLLQAGAVFGILVHGWGLYRTAQVALTVFVLTWIIEAIGSTTGYPFGVYSYTDMLQPQLLHVPVLIPIAWFMMLPSAWAVASVITGGQRGIGFVLVSALAFTAWDLFLDPQMVMWNLWVWEQPGGYFGIPWTNYLGWFLSASVITAVVRPAELPHPPLILIYALVLALEVIGLVFFWGLVGPGLVGFAGMGGMLAWAWYIRQQQGTA